MTPQTKEPRINTSHSCSVLKLYAGYRGIPMEPYHGTLLSFSVRLGISRIDPPSDPRNPLDWQVCLEAVQHNELPRRENLTDVDLATALPCCRATASKPVRTQNRVARDTPSAYLEAPWRQAVLSRPWPEIANYTRYSENGTTCPRPVAM